jgi:CRP-like cAMP-binding protein
MSTATFQVPQPELFTADSKRPDSSAWATENPPSPVLQELIAQQPFFKGLNDHQQRLLAESALEMQFAPDEIIFQQGSPANRFFLILAGKVVLETELAEQNVIRIQTLGPGDDLGWSWLIAPYSLHFSARAVEPTRTIFFFGTRLREQCEQDHELGYQIMKRIAEVATQGVRALQLCLMQCRRPEKLDQ